MDPAPFDFHHALDDFDLSKLPIDATLLKNDPGLLARAVQAYYESVFTELGGTAVVTIKNGIAHVPWRPGAGDPEEAVFARSLELLQRGEYFGAEPLLRALLGRHPDHPDTLCNLGMLLSDKGRLDEAIQLLARLVQTNPSHVKGWIALGVALARNREPERALQALRQAAALEPENPHVLKNMGGLLMSQSPEQALPFLKRAAKLLPDDQGSHFALSQCLLELGQRQAADAALERVINLSPLTPIAEEARRARTRLAESSIRSMAGGGLRMDAVTYCLDALEKFRSLSTEQVRTIVFEIAMLGRSGFGTNDPSQKYELRSLAGDFSGLHLVSLLYAGLRQLNLDTSVGMDLSREYEAAKMLLDSKSGS